MINQLEQPSTHPERTVLLIDDDADSRTIYGRILRHVGYRVIEAATARDGLYAADIDFPHAAVVDIELPDLDGCVLIQRLRASPKSSALPIIALSAHVLPRDREAAMAAGCDAYVSKPAAPRTVAAAVDALLAVPRAFKHSAQPAHPLELWDARP
jgi:two-component system, cell cycle response regulator DivK